MIKKVLILLLLFLFIPKIVFAIELGEILVKGKIIDEYSNPVGGAIIVFKDKIGTKVKSVTTDLDGKYEAIVPQGVYAITADGPKGSDFVSTTFTNREIFSNDEIDFKLTSALPDTTSPTSNTNLFYYGLVLLVALGIGGFAIYLTLNYMKRRR